MPLRPVLITLLVVALLPSGVRPEAREDTFVAELLAKMTLEEKIGQMNLRGRGSRGSYDPLSEELETAVRAGQVGTLINIMRVDEVDRIQRIAIEESPSGIPLLFGRDVIHGLHALAPIPLGQAASWNPGLVHAGARQAARDATAYGIRWILAPMLDLTRDPRWGRIAESTGEDPYLGARMAEALVRGFQGDDLADPSSVAACVKHFAAYGAVEGGRDYNTVTLSEDELRNIYLPPYRAAVEAGAASFMSAFNEVNGIPASAHPWLLRDVLKGEWGFDGFVVSDWDSVEEMVPHGFSVDTRQAARQAATAGLDMEMTSTAFADHLAELVRSGEVDEAVVDEAAGRILRIKYRLGLFETPYRRTDRDPKVLSEEALGVARQLATESAVLLRNEGVLPLSGDLGSVAVVGPLADAPHEQLGTWSFDGRHEDSRTPLAVLTERLGAHRVHFAAGLDHSRDTSDEGFAAALAAAEAADVILFFGGEEAILSGEAHSRAEIDLPGAQEELLTRLAATEKPVVLVLLAGRPLTMHDLLPRMGAVLVAWHPGTMAGEALADLLLGDASPSGRLPVTWPRTVGQIPLYYNHKMTGRPPRAEEMIPFDQIPVGAWQSSLANTAHYLDAGMDPEFPFGFGLTYTTFAYDDLEVSLDRGSTDGIVSVAATVTNTGGRTAAEVVQIYVRDMVGSRTRPVRELKGFRKITLEPGASERVEFRLTTDDLAFFSGDGWTAEPGEFRVWVAPHAAAGLEGSFVLADITSPPAPD